MADNNERPGSHLSRTDRVARLAAELRANLKRRKAQARAREEARDTSEDALRSPPASATAKPEP